MGIIHKYFLNKIRDREIPPQKAKIETREAVNVRILKLAIQIIKLVIFINLFLLIMTTAPIIIKATLIKAAKS
ncbi:hypothetical protein SDC9_94062 [bioreactor metagenome]|uniref:Uncharacterized protein n=1 Tax=bioreactor metagenome TaxID=1076179 RepID=A0A645A918_9ZZZZ